MERHFESRASGDPGEAARHGQPGGEQIRQSVRALVDRDEALVQAVLAHEEEMDLL